VVCCCLKNEGNHTMSDIETLEKAVEEQPV